MMLNPADNLEGVDEILRDGGEPAFGRVTFIGATMADNRGSDAVVRAAIGQMRLAALSVRLTLFSERVADDVAQLSHEGDSPVEVLSFSPVQMVLALPFALAAGVVRKCGLGFRWMLPMRTLRAVAASDVVVDLSGTSFVDGRYAALLHDVLSVLIPRCLGVDVMKCAHSVGPARSWLTRTLACRTLRHVHTLVTRGQASQRCVAALSLPVTVNVRTAADIAFADSSGEADHADAAAIAPWLSHAAFSNGGARVVAVAPSELVERYCRDLGIDYVWHLTQFIDELIDKGGFGVMLLPYALRQDDGGGTGNDLPLCRRIFELVEAKSRCVLVDRALNASQLRQLVGACGFVITSRHGALVAALQMGVAPLTVGWSHQYAETLGAFGLDHHDLPCRDLSATALRRVFKEIEARQGAVRQQIRQHLPAAVASSLENVRLALEIVNESLARKRAKAAATRRPASEHGDSEIETSSS